MPPPAIIVIRENTLKKINFEGRLSYHFYNEPLLHPKIREFIFLAAKILPGTKQIIFTNGDFLTDDVYDSLINAGVFHFFVTSHEKKEVKARSRQNVLFPSDHIFTNRGGILKKKFSKKSLTYPCLAPSEMLIVTINGNVLICYEDYYKKYVMGNIFENSIDEVWNSSDFINIRNLLSQGKRSDVFGICQKCNNMNHKSYQNINDLIEMGKTTNFQ